MKRGRIDIEKETLSTRDKDIYGDHNVIRGPDLVIYGDYNDVEGPYVEIRGHHNTGSGNGAILYGNDNVWHGTNVVDRGKRNTLLPFKPKHVTRSVCPQDGTTMITYESVDGALVIKKQRKRKTKTTTDQEYVVGPTTGQCVDDVEYDEENEKGTRCAVCLSNVVNTIALPCKHMCVCCTCARALCYGGAKNELYKVGAVKCPECREAVQSIEKTF